MTDAHKVIVGILTSLFITAIISSAKAITDVQVLKSENANVHETLKDAKEERRIINANIIKILGKI